jgi:hypothetical protein
VGGSYADGSSFGPEKMSLGEKKDWTYVVAVHSPPPPPTVVDQAVDNQDKLPIDIEMMVVDKDGKSKMKPTIRVKALTRSDIDAYEVASLTVTATYSSGKKSATSTFKPSKEKQVFTVPPEPVEAVVQGAPTSDPPPDERLAVTGLVTYRGRQEMIAHDGNQRKIIRAGEEGAVDGGSLLAVHPLGGVVKMPSGNFYLYPLGRKFKERMKLDASHEEELAAAIDACAGQ